MTPPPSTGPNECEKAVLTSHIGRSDRFLLTAAILAPALCFLSWLALGQLGVSQVNHEASGVAERVVMGYGFSSPYLPPDHLPTTICAPLYVWLIALVYKILGIHTTYARVFLQCLNLLFYSVTLVTVFKICEKLLSPLCARVFAIAFALHPLPMLVASKIWENTFSGMLLALILYILLFEFRTFGILRSLMFGLLLGVTSLSNPVWTVSYPFLCIGAFYFNKIAPFRRWVTGAAIIFLGFAVVVGPWVVRNYNVTHKFIFIRGMGGFALFLGNNAEAFGGHGKGFEKYYLYDSAGEREKLKDMGEVHYDEMMMSDAQSEIRSHPGRYILVTMARIAQWWTGDIDLTMWRFQQKRYKDAFIGGFLTLIGLATSACGLFGIIRLGHKRTILWPLWIFLTILPIPYYLITIGFRYQGTLTPFLLIPVAHFVSDKWAKLRRNVVPEIEKRKTSLCETKPA